MRQLGSLLGKNYAQVSYAKLRMQKINKSNDSLILGQMENIVHKHLFFMCFLLCFDSFVATNDPRDGKKFLRNLAKVMATTNDISSAEFTNPTLMHNY